MAQPPVVWNISSFENNYTNAKYTTDRTNINAALARLANFDIAATHGEETRVSTQLPLPQTPDNLQETIVDCAKRLCNSGDRAPIRFRGIFKNRDPSPNEGLTETYIQIPAYGNNPGISDWLSELGYNWPSRVNTLNDVPLASRAAARFRFEVTFGNSLQGLNWTEAQWMETAIHEICIHVVQRLHQIELWRQGHDWPGFDGEGDLDHLHFRFRGYRRYNFWINKMTALEKQTIWPAVEAWENKEQGRDSVDRRNMTDFYSAIAVGSHVALPVMLCLAVADHFPNVQGQLVKDATNPTLVDKIQSHAFLDELKALVDRVFQYQNGTLTTTSQPFSWWHA